MKSSAQYLLMRKYKTNITNTEQTIQELRESIDSMEKMIEKSHRILVNTKVISHKQVKSDSVELRLNSKGKRTQNNSIFNSTQSSKINPLNTINRSLDQNSLSRVTEVKTPQKTKPFKEKRRLKIDTGMIDEDHEKQKILICDNLSPISKEDQKKKHFFDSSFASSMDQNYLKRFKTQGFNESREDSFINDSLEKKTEQATYLTEKPKKIILKKRKDRMVNNLNDLERQNQKVKRTKIFGNYKQGKYSYAKGDLTKKQIKEAMHKKTQSYGFRASTITSSGEKCMKNEKENCKMDLQEFIKKVKKYGFIERYLSHTQICSIYNYLKKSSIPQYKWPLFVVDEVYEKMQSPKCN